MHSLDPKLFESHSIHEILDNVVRLNPDKDMNQINKSILYHPEQLHGLSAEERQKILEWRESAIKVNDIITKIDIFKKN